MPTTIDATVHNTKKSSGGRHFELRFKPGDAALLPPGENRPLILVVNGTVWRATITTNNATNAPWIKAKLLSDTGKSSLTRLLESLGVSHGNVLRFEVPHVGELRLEHYASLEGPPASWPVPSHAEAAASATSIPVSPRTLFELPKHGGLLPPTLTFVKDIASVAASVATFAREAQSHAHLASRLVQQCTYWIAADDGNSFAPAKFVAYEAMTFDRYALAGGDVWGSRFDGKQARTQITKLTFRQFRSDPALSSALKTWAEITLGVVPGTAALRERLRFVRLPSRAENSSKAPRRWRDAILDAAVRVAGNGGRFTRNELLHAEGASMLQQTNSAGKSPGQTVTRELQRMQKDGIVEHEGPGAWRLLVPPLIAHSRDWSDEEIDAAIEREVFRLPEIPTSDFLAATRCRRGQDRVRQHTLANYRHCCAVCDIVDEKLLIASHIEAWADNPDARGKLSNVICLCRPHDCMFETGYWSLMDNLTVIRKLPVASETISRILPEPGSFKHPKSFPPHVAHLRAHREKHRIGIDWNVENA